MILLILPSISMKFWPNQYISFKVVCVEGLCMHFWLESLIGNTTNSTDGRLLLDAHCSTAAAADLTAVTTD